MKSYQRMNQKQIQIQNSIKIDPLIFKPSQSPKDCLHQKVNTINSIKTRISTITNQLTNCYNNNQQYILKHCCKSQTTINKVYKINQPVMLQKRQQKPISPQEMFSHLLSQSYRQVQCQAESDKINKQKIILLQLIQQYEQSIHSQILKINQIGNLEKLRLQKIQQLERLKKQRQIIQNSVIEQLNNVSITPNQHEEKLKLTAELQEVQCVNNKIKLKLKDLYQYANKLQIHNQRLTSQNDIAQTKAVNRMRINSEDWRVNVQALRRKQQLEQNQMRIKILQKQSKNIQNVRKQQEQINRRNQDKWEEFRKTVLTQRVAPSYDRGASEQIRNFASRKFPESVFSSYRVL